MNRIIRAAMPTDIPEIMQHNIEKYGFTYCGIIYLANGDERLAYQMTKNGIKYEVDFSIRQSHK